MNSLLVPCVLDMLLAGLLGKIIDHNDNGDDNDDDNGDDVDDESEADDDNDDDYMRMFDGDTLRKSPVPLKKVGSSC